MEGAEDRPQARRLVERLRPHVADERVLAAVASVDRACFVPPDQREHAWENAPLPIGSGQTISQPLVVARMCELLRVREGFKALDVGAGSGYHAALLAALGARVWAIERFPELAEQAVRNLAAAGVSGVEVIVGDGAQGYAPAAPYEAINVAAAAWREVPPALEEQLAQDGRLIAPVARRGQRLVLVERTAEGFRRTPLDAVRFVPLV